MTAGYYFYANVIAVAISGLAQAGRAVIGIVFLNRTNVNHSSCGADSAEFTTTCTIPGEMNNWFRKFLIEFLETILRTRILSGGK